jgi:predicted enzyme related to lactoylglutathione lyase
MPERTTQQMTTIRRLEHVGVGAARAKFDDTVAFYERVFGWHRVREVPGHFTFIGDGEGGRLELLPNDAPPLPSPHHLAFGVPLADFDATVTLLCEAGAPVEAPTANAVGDRLCFFTDPAGNRAQIVARAEALAP